MPEKRATEENHPRPGESGMTLIEVLIVVAIIGILVNIGVPALLYAMQKARAQAIVHDFLAVRDAAFTHQIDTGAYPRDGRRGREPREFRPYLKGVIDWDNDALDYQYDWDNWVRRNGRPRRPGTGVLVGFSVVTRNEPLRRLLEEVYDGPIKKRRNRIIFVIEPYGRR